jgi:thymidylate synthase
MQKFEKDYAQLVKQILDYGEERETRNGKTLSGFGTTLVVNELLDGVFPLLQGRKMFYKGVFGELAAILRRPKHIGDFTKWGCNYWGKWADIDGYINVDYGNAWFDFEGVNQIERLKDALSNNPTDRRMLINGWNPKHLDDLSLPCCHYSYQFYVTNDGIIHMQWIQRSVDVMIGLPSDIVFAAAWLIAIANEFGFRPGAIHMVFGDTHIYEAHLEGARTYYSRVVKPGNKMPIYYNVNSPTGKPFELFEPADIELSAIETEPAIKLELL